MSESTFSILLGAMALSCLAAALSRRFGRFPWAALGILGSTVLAYALATQGSSDDALSASLPASHSEGLRLVGQLVAILVAFRIGTLARRFSGEVPTGLLFTLGLGVPIASVTLVAGIGRELGVGQGITTLIIGALLALPDGRCVPPVRHRGEASSRGGREEIPGLSTLQGVWILVLLPTLVVLSGLSTGSFASGDPTDGVSVSVEILWQTHLAGILSALAAGAGLATLARSVRTRLDDAWKRSLVLWIAAAGGASLAEWIHPGSSPIAAVAAGLVCGDPVGENETPESRSRREGPMAVASFVAITAVLVGLALECGRGRQSVRWLAGAGVWASATAVRTLRLLCLGGFYNLVRPHVISPRWAIRVTTLSYAGALSGAWLLSSGADVAPLRSVIFPALVFALAFESIAAAFFSRRFAIRDRDRSREWQVVRGRRLALRAASQTLEMLAEEGELEHLASSDRELLRAHLEQQRTLADIELEELLHSAAPVLREHGREAVVRELARAATRALEESARAGTLSRRSVEELRAEVSRWLSPGGDGPFRDAIRPTTSEERESREP